MLKIRHHEHPELTAALVRDVCYEHPKWVHEQLEVGSEQELQDFLTHCDIDDIKTRPGRPDCFGIFWDPDPPIHFTTYFYPDGPSHSYIYWSALGAKITVYGATAYVEYSWYGSSPATAGGPPKPETIDLLDRDEVLDLYRHLGQKGTQAPEAQSTFSYIRELCGFKPCPQAKEGSMHHTFAWLTSHRTDSGIYRRCWYCGYETGWQVPGNHD